MPQIVTKKSGEITIGGQTIYFADLDEAECHIEKLQRIEI